MNAADSAHESTESDDDFRICEICNDDEVVSLDGADGLSVHCVIADHTCPCRKVRLCSNVPVVANWSILLV